MTPADTILASLKNNTALGAEELLEHPFSAVIFRDRDYPEGDDVCTMILSCLAEFRLPSREGSIFCVLTTEGKIFTFRPVSRSDREIYGKYAKEISL